MHEALCALLRVAMAGGIPWALVIGVVALAKRARYWRWHRALAVFPPVPGDTILEALPRAFLELNLDGAMYGGFYSLGHRGGGPVQPRRFQPEPSPLLLGAQALHLPPYEHPGETPLGWRPLPTLAIPRADFEPGEVEGCFVVKRDPFTVLYVRVPGAAQAVRRWMETHP